MTWWRRDPSLWARTPIHRHACRTLRDHEASLRARCFSKSNPKTASHKEDDSSRPEGMSSLEWAQLQHRKLLKRIFVEDPYKALFGASESMLKGEGLKNWDRVVNTFPRWMWREMGLDDVDGAKEKQSQLDPKGTQDDKTRKSPSSRDQRDRTTSTDRTYPRKVAITDETSPKTYDSIFPLSPFRSTPVGIDSPSDSRRPREQSIPSPYFNPEPVTPQNQTNFSTSETKDEKTTRTKYDSIFAELDSFARVMAASSSKAVDQKATSKNAAARETIYIDEFLADKLPHINPTSTAEKNKSQWRQTSLERRASTEFVPNSRTRTEKPTGDRSQFLKDISKDDVDTLRADDVRASMGRRKISEIDRNESKKNLHEKIQVGQKDGKTLDQEYYLPNIKQQTTPELKEKTVPSISESLHRNDTVSKSSEGLQTDPKTVPRRVSSLEISLESMVTWLHGSGNAMAHLFFQDPVDVLAEQDRIQHGISSDAFYERVINGIQKSRDNNWKGRLVNDIQASKSLIERLTNNEQSVMFTAGIINGSVRRPHECHDKSAEDRAQVLKRGVLATDNEFKKACEAVDGMSTTPPSKAYGKRLSIAADFLRYNLKLTRAMILGLQTRLETSKSSENQVGAGDRRDLTNRLLALQDTQLALSKIVSRRMQMLGISTFVDETKPVKVLDVETPMAADLSKPTEVQKPMIEIEADEKRRILNANADPKLAAEISDLKKAMRGLSDDGYSRSPKPTAPVSFYPPGPLSHSLFRPFGLQLESLGKDVEDNSKSMVSEDTASQKEADENLVDEVKKVYEDVYGKITVFHRQPLTPTEPPKEGLTSDSSKSDAKNRTFCKNLTWFEPRKQSSTQLLKEDEVSPTISRLDSLDDMSKQVWNTTLEAEQQKTVNSPKKPNSIQLLKEDEVSPTISRLDSLDTMSNQVWDTALKAEQEGTENSYKKESSIQLRKKYGILPKISRLDTLDDMSKQVWNTALEAEQQKTAKISPATKETGSKHGSPSTSTPAEFRPEYRIYCHDPTTDELLIAPYPLPPSTSTSPPPSTIPHHIALTKLTHPQKFFPHLPLTYEAVAANANMLILRHTPILGEAPLTETIRVPVTAAEDVDTEESWTPGINPIDGTTRLSPTGFVGNSVSLEREFEERRKAAGDQRAEQLRTQGGVSGGMDESYRKSRERILNGQEGTLNERRREEKREERKRKKEEKSDGDYKRVGVGGVVKTGILAVAGCYVVGVVAELVR